MPPRLASHRPGLPDAGCARRTASPQQLVQRITNPAGSGFLDVGRVRCQPLPGAGGARQPHPHPRAGSGASAGAPGGAGAAEEASSSQVPEEGGQQDPQAQEPEHSYPQCRYYANEASAGASAWVGMKVQSFRWAGPLSESTHCRQRFRPACAGGGPPRLHTEAALH
jgi:hypothetical protein